MILTQHPITLTLSRPTVEVLVSCIEDMGDWTAPLAVQCELDNFRNLLQNLLERSEPKTDNFDLIGA